MLIFGYILIGIAALIAIPTFIFSIYMLLLTLGSLIPHKIKNRPDCSAKIAILIPAHNEEEKIENSVISLISEIDYPSELYELIVIADNCTDSTSYIASFSGARVLERTNEWKKGKYHAIEWGINQLEKDKLDLVLILNTDSSLKCDSLRKLDAEFAEGYIAMQLEEKSSVKAYTWRQALKLAMEAHLHHTQPYARDKIGFSADLTGNGTCLSKHILEQLPFTGSENRDFREYSTQLISNGEKVRFISTQKSGVITNRLSPILNNKAKENCIRPIISQLFKGAIRGNFTALEALINLILPPAGTIFFSLAVLLFAGIMLCLGSDLPECKVLLDFGLSIIVIALFGLLSLHLYILTGILQYKLPVKVWISLLFWPLIAIENLFSKKNDTPFK